MARSNRNFLKNWLRYSTEAWKMYTKLFLPIYLDGILPPRYYEQFSNLVCAIEQATGNEVKDDLTREL